MGSSETTGTDISHYTSYWMHNSLMAVLLLHVQVADEWELKKDDIKLLNKPLGKGAFGEVFKGILQPSAKVSNRKNSQPNAMNFVVAVKILKGSNYIQCIY